MFARSLQTALVLAVCSPVLAGDVVVPVATAKFKDRIYTTTVAVHNESNADAECTFSYIPVNAPTGQPLVATERVPAHGNRVMEDFLMEVGAIGSARVSCRGGEVQVLARIQDSTDGAKTFREGHVFRALSPEAPITQGAPRTVTTRTDLALVEVSATPAVATIRATNRDGVVVGAKRYEFPPRGYQPVNLEHLFVDASELDVEITVEGGGAIAVQTATADPAVGRLVVRVADERREAMEAHFAAAAARAKVATTAEPTAHYGSVIAPMASFKAAPFQEPANGMIFMRDRWYDPSTGTFLTPDPEGYDDSSNPYIFGRGDPVNNSDPTGRHTKVTRRVNGLEFELLAPDPDEVRRGELGMSGSFVNPFTGKRESFSWDQHESELLLMQARWGNPLMKDAFAQFFGMSHDQVDVSGLRLYWNSLWHHKVDIALSAGFTIAMLAPEVRLVDPKTLRWTQRTAGGGGRADTLRASMSKGWSGEPIDAVATEHGLVTVDHTRAAVAIELNMTKVPVRIHLPGEPLPPEMLGRFGNARTWGEAAAQRAAGQRPPLPPTGTPTPPRLPKPRGQQ